MPRSVDSRIRGTAAMIKTLRSQVKAHVDDTSVHGGAVTSVFTRTGAVTAASNDYTWAQINKATSDVADLTTKNVEDLDFSDNTTNNASTTKHGLLLKLDNTATNFLNGTGAWSAPAATLADAWKVESTIKFAANTQTHDFTGLTGNSDTAYWLFGRISNTSGSTSSPNLRLNGANWAVNRQYLDASSTTISGGRDTGIDMFHVTNGSTAIFSVFLPASDDGDNRHALVDSALLETTNIQGKRRWFYISTPAASTEITSVGIASDVANGLSTNTVLTLMKLV